MVDRAVSVRATAASTRANLVRIGTTSTRNCEYLVTGRIKTLARRRAVNPAAVGITRRGSRGVIVTRPSYDTKRQRRLRHLQAARSESTKRVEEADLKVAPRELKRGCREGFRSAVRTTGRGT